MGFHWVCWCCRSLITYIYVSVICTMRRGLVHCFKSWCSIFYVYCLYDRAALESTCFSTYRLMLVKVQYDSFLTFFCRILWSLKDRTWFLFWALMFGNMHTTCRYNYHTVQRSNSLNMILCCKNIPCDAMSFCNFIHFLAFSATIDQLTFLVLILY